MVLTDNIYIVIDIRLGSRRLPRPFLAGCLTLSDPHSKRFKIAGGCARRTRVRVWGWVRVMAKFGTSSAFRGWVRVWVTLTIVG